MNDRRTITIQTAAERLGVTPKTIRRRVSDGTLRAYRIGPRLIRVYEDDVDALLTVIPTVAGAR